MLKEIYSEGTLLCQERLNGLLLPTSRSIHFLIGVLSLSYWLGVAFALTAGISNNVGTVLQKKVVNEIPLEAREERFFRTLAKNPIWMTGLLLQYALGAAMIILAQIYIGPALVPGLMSSGLIVLSVGTIKLVGESLRRSEVVGIMLLMLGIVLFSLSELEISIPDYDFLDFGYLARLFLFTGMLFAIVLALTIIRRVNPQFHSICRALVSGLCLATSAFWISPMLATIVHVFSGTFILIELGLFTISCIILVGTNIYAVGNIQDAFKTGQASLLVPIQQLPVQVIPGLVYLIVFFLTPPTGFSMIWFIAGVLLAIISSFLLGKRQVLLEGIQ